MHTPINIERLIATSRLISPTGELHRPLITEKTNRYVMKALTTNQLCSGDFVYEFETRLKTITGASYVVAVSSGTMALYTAIAVTRPDARTAITQPLTFVATLNAMRMHNIYIRFVDVDENGGMARPMIKADICIPVHVLGLPARVEEIAQYCKKNNMTLIEDAAAALGSYRNGVHCGLFGEVGILSFNANKIITTAGGGAILTHDKKIAERARKFIAQNKETHLYEWTHEDWGTNARMSNVQAAIGCAQLEDWEKIQACKERNYNLYTETLGDSVIRPRPGEKWNYWLISFKTENKNEILKKLIKNGIEARPLWKPHHKFGYYKTGESFPMTEKLYDTVISLPSGVII